MRWFFTTRWLAGLIVHEAPANGPPPRKLWSFFRWSLSGGFRIIGVGAGVNAIAGLMEVSIMVMLGVIVDAAVAAESLNAFWTDNWGLLAVWLTILLVLRPLAFFGAAGFQSIAAAPNVFKLVLSRIHRYTLGQSVSFFDNDFAGRIAQKQMQTTRAMVDVVTESMNAISVAVSSVLATAIFVGVIDYRLAIVMAVWLVLYFGFLRYFLPWVRRLSAARAASRAMVTGQVVDTITNIKTVKLFASSRHEDRAAIGALSEFRDKSIEWAEMAVFFRLGLTLIAGILPAAVLSLTLYLVTLGTASVGDLAAASAMSIRLAHMTGWVSWTLMAIYGNIGEVEDGMRTLAPPHSLTDAENAGALTGPPQIAFDQVTFAYGQKIGGVFDLSLTVAEGEKIGIVGASGAGKSTLVALLLRLYDAEQGRITIGGQDIAKVTQQSLRQQIGMVTQETAMFNRSARDNILYGNPEAGEDQMIAATKQARAHTFIQDLRDYKGRGGYDAHLGERGVKLSGGQRQRIALARAILKDAPILVLDEATSALDSEVEAEIQDALTDVMQGKTVIAIAHRLSTIARMDRVIVLDQGRIVEQGTHADLLAQDGLYARYWARQSGGFLGLSEAAE